MPRKILLKSNGHMTNKSETCNIQTVSIVIDFSYYNDINAFYHDFKLSFRLPDYFGANFDALWDALTSGMLPLPLTLYLKHIQSLSWGIELLVLFKQASDELGDALSIIYD